MTVHPTGARCDADRLERLLRDELGREEAAAMVEHLDRCEACQRRIERLAAGSRWWDEVRSLDESEEASHPRGPAEEGWLGFLEPPEKEGQIGRLGSYEVIEVIGRGGMGVVLKAHDPGLNRLVAIKVMAPHLSGTGAARRRFAREAKAAAAVSHEHVVTIHAVDAGGLLPYLVMQHIPGESLQHRIDQGGALETSDLLRIGMQAAAGLAAAHAQGLIHRDVKPSNILLEDGVERVKLTDFGLALAVDDASRTETGFIAGTPQYMSPEQARGERVDHRSDLFSLGSVLYAMACGRPPFRGSSTVAVLRRVGDEAARPVRQVNPDVPEWLEAIIARLHARDPEARFQSAAEVAELLGRWVAHLHNPHLVPRPECPGEGRAMRRVASGRVAMAAGVLSLACIVGLGAAPGAARQVLDGLATVLRINTGDGVLVIETDEPNIKVRIDGEEVVLTDTGLKEIRVRPGGHAVKAEKDGATAHDELITVQQGDRRLVRIRRERPRAPGLSLPAAPRPDVSTGIRVGGRSGAPSPSPLTGVAQAVSSLVERLKRGSGEKSAVEKERFGLFMIGIERGDVTRVADEPERGLYYCGSPSWSPDGRRLIFDASPGAIFNQTRIRMIAPEGQMDLGAGACPAVSPDGRRTAFLLNPGAIEGAAQGIWVMQADGTGRRWLGGYGRPRWSPDGHRLLVCDFSEPCEASLMDESGDWRPIEGLAAYRVPSWVDRDTIVAAIRLDADGEAADAIALLDVSHPGQAGLKEVLWHKGQGTDVTPWYPICSPGAGRCIFVGSDARGMALYRLDRGWDEPKRLEPGRFDRTIQDLAISPDGRYVLFASDRDARPSIERAPSADVEPDTVGVGEPRMPQNKAPMPTKAPSGVGSLPPPR